MSQLAVYAVSQQSSKGRKYPEPEHPYRTAFERDRDRIIHSSAFRRLEGKTQVFTIGVNDHYRTRLTHSIEVAQIGRTIAKLLGVNQDLTEAICLGHDLGHSPFGHCGEEVLNRIMSEFGGFEHNRQTLRIVELLEHPYPDFAGLNLLYETRLGFCKHKSPYDNSSSQEDFNSPNASIEGQIADIADRIAYNCHDLEDGMRSKLITQEQLANLELCCDIMTKINITSIDDPFIRNIRISKSIIDNLVGDVIKTSLENIKKFNPCSYFDVINNPEKMVTFSVDSEKKILELEKFLLNNLYYNPQLVKNTAMVRTNLEKLFSHLCRKPDDMPKYYRKFIDNYGLQRAVCDYISGMTDRYCLEW